MNHASRSEDFTSRLASAEKVGKAEESYRFLRAHEQEILAARKRGVTLKEIAKLAAESGTKVSMFVLRQFLSSARPARESFVSRVRTPVNIGNAKPGFRVARDEDL